MDAAGDVVRCSLSLLFKFTVMRACFGRCGYDTGCCDDIRRQHREKLQWDEDGPGLCLSPAQLLITVLLLQAPALLSSRAGLLFMNFIW